MADPKKPEVTPGPTTATATANPVTEQAEKIPIKPGFKHLKKGKQVCEFGKTFKTWVPDAVIKRLKLKDWLFLGGPKEPNKEEKRKSAEKLATDAKK